MMAANSRGLLFRKRNVLGVVLIAGIWLGAYLGKWGLGLGDGAGDGGHAWLPSGSNSSSNGIEDRTPAEESETETPTPRSSAKFVKVIIDDREFLLVSGTKEEPITLPKLMELVKQVPGDDDGIRLRVYEKASARMSTEESLKEAIEREKIPDTAVIWVPAGATK